MPRPRGGLTGEPSGNANQNTLVGEGERLQGVLSGLIYVCARSLTDNRTREA